jgi:hypothetical protein
MFLRTHRDVPNLSIIVVRGANIRCTTDRRSRVLCWPVICSVQAEELQPAGLVAQIDRYRIPNEG